MIRTCYRCPAFTWKYEEKLPQCKLGYTLQNYQRPDDCKKKPKSDKEMFRLRNLL